MIVYKVVDTENDNYFEIYPIGYKEGEHVVPLPEEIYSLKYEEDKDPRRSFRFIGAYVTIERKLGMAIEFGYKKFEFSFSCNLLDSDIYTPFSS